jgi:hypothetical protein
VAVVSSQWRADMRTFISPPPQVNRVVLVVVAKDALSVQNNVGEVVTVMSRQLGPHPRAVFLDGSPWTTRLVGNNTTTTQVVEMYPLMKGARASGREFFTSGRSILDPSCEYMHDWQTTFHPTCNEFHATNLADVFADKRAELLGEGWWRQGWKMTYPRTATNAILKTSQ